MSRTLWPAIVMLRRFAADHLTTNYADLHGPTANPLKNGKQYTRYYALKKMLPVVKRLLKQEEYLETKKGIFIKETPLGVETHQIRTTTAIHSIEIPNHPLIARIELFEHPKSHYTDLHFKNKVTPNFTALSNALRANGYEIETGKSTYLPQIQKDGHQVASFNLLHETPILTIKQPQHVEELLRIIFPPNFSELAKTHTRTKPQRRLM